jgi:hypothetical protein
MLENYRVAAQLVAYRVVLSSTELVSIRQFYKALGKIQEIRRVPSTSHLRSSGKGAVLYVAATHCQTVRRL